MQKLVTAAVYLVWASVIFCRHRKGQIDNTADNASSVAHCVFFLLHLA